MSEVRANLFSRSVGTLLLAGIFLCHPVTFRIGGPHGPEVGLPYAWASDGGDDGSGDDGGGDDGGGDDGGGDDGGGDDGSGDDGSGDDGSGDDGENSGNSSDGEQQSTSSDTSDSYRTAGAVAASVVSAGIVVTFQDGSREMLGKGVLTRSAPSGEVVETRQATGADMARFRILLERLGVKRTGLPSKTGDTKPTRIRLRGSDIKVLYPNGWVEEIRGSRYRLKDSYGRRVADRRATDDDRARLFALIPKR